MKEFFGKKTVRSAHASLYSVGLWKGNHDNFKLKTDLLPGEWVEQRKQITKEFNSKSLY